MIEIKSLEKEIKWQTEYKVRPVTRYVVTRYTSAVDQICIKGSENCGEFDNLKNANTVCESLAKCHLDDFYTKDHDVYYKLYSHEYDETEYENNDLVKVSSSR